MSFDHQGMKTRRALPARMPSLFERAEFSWEPTVRDLVSRGGEFRVNAGVKLW